MEKSPDAFRTISEVADEIDVPQHVLRFWESRFSQIRPMKRGGGRRYYRPDDVDLLRGVRHLLYGEGYTIRGVQRILRDEGTAFVQDVWRSGALLPPADREEAGEMEGAEGRAEPKLSLFPVIAVGEPAGSTTLSDEVEERASQKLSHKPSENIAVETPPAAKSVRTRLNDEQKQKLQTVLDELVQCHRLIETALQED